MILPRFGLIRQLSPNPPEPDVEHLLAEEILRTRLLAEVRPGERVLLTAGSRGINSKPRVLAGLVKVLKAAGAEPFIYPAMGSHGGGTALGQVGVLTDLGITAATIGAAIYDGWESVRIGTTEAGAPVFVDRAALDADRVILVNRIKEHTDYIGTTESGLIKIAVVGLGRQPGAAAMHQVAIDRGMQNAIHDAARVILKHVRVVGGVAILEDRHNTLRRLEAVPAARLFEREPELFRESQEHKPRLPFDRFDLLIIDEIGKEFSGTGADSKVLGRIMNRFESECTEPTVKRVVMLDLSEKTHGNAIGIGLADYTTLGLVGKIDYRKTNLNCITGGRVELGKVPIALATEREAIETALNTLGLWTPDSLRALWVSDTKHLSILAASEALLRESAQRADLAVDDRPLFGLPFHADGALKRLKTFVSIH
jgi:uncharacterized protein (DUF362 family)